MIADVLTYVFVCMLGYDLEESEEENWLFKGRTFERDQAHRGMTLLLRAGWVKAEEKGGWSRWEWSKKNERKRQMHHTGR